MGIWELFLTTAETTNGRKTVTENERGLNANIMSDPDPRIIISSEVTNQFLESVLETGFEYPPALKGIEESIYHRTQACIEEQDKLAKFIPSPPKVLIKLLQLLQNADADFKQIRDIIAEDAGLIGEVVHIANSPLYLTRAGKIDSIEKAVALLGINGVTKVATTVMMRNTMTTKSHRYKKPLKKLWSFCLQSGESCQSLSDNENSFASYLLGLVHQIGSVSIISLLSNETKDEDLSAIKDFPILQRLMAENCSRLSSFIAAEWGMPEEYLLSLNEFDQLKRNAIADESYEHRCALTRNLEAGSLAAQGYNLWKSGRMEKETLFQILAVFDVDEKRADKIITRLDLAQAIVA